MVGDMHLASARLGHDVLKEIPVQCVRHRGPYVRV
jgi:hypothetical protein